LLLDRLKNWVKNKNILTEFQAGLRKGYSTVDNIFSLTSIARSYIDGGKKLYAYFVDFRAAFDSIDRRTLNYKFSNIGISTAFLNVLQSLYTDNLATVWDREHLSEWLTTKAGVKQGCLLSPLLFSLFLNDITDCLPCGIQICGCSIKALLYADDIVILAESPVELQTMINALHKCCLLWGLLVNTEKSKVLIFKRHWRRLDQNEKWNLGPIQLEIVKSYKYLGVWIHHKGRFNNHLQVKLAINCTWKSLLGKKDVPMRTV